MNELKIMREQLGLTQSQFAIKLGIPLRTYKRWESGQVPKNLKNLLKIIFDERSEKING